MPYPSQYGFIPYGFQQSLPNAQPINGLTQVVGIEGARAYQIPPNSTVPLLDANNDIFYVKSTDATGFPTIRIFSFVEQKEEPQVTSDNFATKDDLKSINDRLDILMEAIANGKQPVPSEQPTAPAKSSGRGSRQRQADGERQSERAI